MEDSKESKVEEEVVVEISVEEVVVTAEEVKLAETAEDKPAESEKDEKPAVTAEEEAPADTAKEEKPAEAAEVEEEATPAAKSSKKGATKKGTATKDEEELPDADENKEDVEMEVVPSTENQKKKRKASSTPQTGDSSGKSPAKRERRERKSVEPFNPEDFKHVDKSVTIVPGRGKELGELKATRASIEKRANSEDLVTAHKLLFPSKNRKLAKKEMLANVLAFSGYLPIKEEGLDKEEQEAIDEDCEAKMGAKTYKMTVPVLKKLCDFFAIDRTNSNGKDILVDVLLDFLGEPSETLLKGASGGKATRTDSKSSSKETGKAKKGDDEEVEEAEEDAGEYSDVGDEKVEAAAEGELPSDDALRMWVRAYVRCHNMQNSTLKHALEVAGEKFGVDLTEKKSRLKELLSDEM